MALPRFQIPIRYETMVKMAGEKELRSIVIQVPDALAALERRCAEIESTGQGSLLIVYGKSGSGKSTLLNTAHLFLQDVRTTVIDRRESIRLVLESYPVHKERLQIIVIKARETLADTPEEALEADLLAINNFLRTEEGARTLVAWPCNKPEMRDALLRHAQEIGGSALCGHEGPLAFAGPSAERYLDIAARTIETLNGGASLASLGITEVEGRRLAVSADTIGSFLQALNSEALRRRDDLARRLPDRDWFELWIVIAAGNDPEDRVAALTYGTEFRVDTGRLLSMSGSNTAKKLQGQPDKIGILATMLGAKLLYLPAATALAVIQDGADASLRTRLALDAPVHDGAERLKESELGQALAGAQVGPKRAGRKPEKARERFKALTQHASKDDGALNRILGQALHSAGLISRWEAEARLGEKHTLSSDLLCYTRTGAVRLEFMWRAEVERAQIAQYVLEKLESYGRAIGFLNGG